MMCIKNEHDSHIKNFIPFKILFNFLTSSSTSTQHKELKKRLEKVAEDTLEKLYACKKVIDAKIKKIEHDLKSRNSQTVNSAEMDDFGIDGIITE